MLATNSQTNINMFNIYIGKKRIQIPDIDVWLMCAVVVLKVLKNTVQGGCQPLEERGRSTWSSLYSPNAQVSLISGRPSTVKQLSIKGGQDSLVTLISLMKKHRGT